MAVKNEKFTISTKGFDDVIDITSKVQNFISFNKIKDGIVNICALCSTASILTLEYEPGMVLDLAKEMKDLVPINVKYDHDETWGENNATAHLKASILGNGATLNIVNGDVDLGTWQKIVLMDFDLKPSVRQISMNVVY